MSSVLIDIPTLQINGNDLQNFLRFIYKHEKLLKDFGAIKVQANIDCKLALKKRPKNLPLNPIMKKIIKINENINIYSVQTIDHINIYSVQTIDHINKSSQKYFGKTDENTFWSSLSSSNNEQQGLNTSLSSNTSFFIQRTSSTYFDLHRIPNQSLLKLGGRKLTNQFVPCVKRAQGPGAIFPLMSARQHLFSIDYHHEGGDHHWYIIPSNQREALQNLIEQQNLSICLDHGQLFIDPSVLDKNCIRYHRIIQHPNEFIVLSAGTLTQSYSEDTSWSESISFALPSWIEDGHATISLLPCQCHVEQNCVVDTIDVALFKQELIQKYITSYLQTTANDETSVFTGSSFCWL
ncbi:unnamed protein product [Adineta steineri]|uniref:JmjC domain-containing protein n=1 Tax=Adineta steineri TaxID=433720 RepID=A0A814BIW4_9BILA|nr:unnamed protein product [Adineta steineri]CAF1332256.1 unnamed protein product [Adineta steineri]